MTLLLNVNVKKALKDLVKKELEYLYALEELRAAAASYYYADQNGPKGKIASQIASGIKNSAQYTARINKFGGNNARYRELVDLINKL